MMRVISFVLLVLTIMGRILTDSQVETLSG